MSGKKYEYIGKREIYRRAQNVLHIELPELKELAYSQFEGCEFIRACQAEIVDEEFMFSKREYERLTGRHPRGNIIAYQIRQSFKPGEITPEEANQVGYETAMRFTKGNHAFIVATHTDKAHIHNHIIFNSTSLDCTHKFRDFFFVGLTLQRLSDIICLEHGLSVIEKKKPSDRVKRTTYPEKKSFRDDIREAIDRILKEGSEKILMSCFINWKMPDTRLSVESIFL